MKPRKYPTPQQEGRAGELFVAADLNRRGALATLYLTNTPRVDVVAMRPDTSRTVNIQVKTKGPRSKGWQWDINTARAERQAPESDFLVLVDLQPAAPAYYVVQLRDIATRVSEKHAAYVARHGGTRPINPDSRHTVIAVKEVEAGQDAWGLLGVIPDAE